MSDETTDTEILDGAGTEPDVVVDLTSDDAVDGDTDLDDEDEDDGPRETPPWARPGR